MKKSQEYRVIKIEDKTRLKLTFIKNFYIQHFDKFDSKKQGIILRELEIVERLLNNEPVNGSEYQSIMSMINDTINNENMFNNYIKRVRNEK